MRKEDLKTGMVVECVNGKKFIVMMDTNDNYSDVLILDGGWEPLEYYNDNLEHKMFDEYNIVKVYDPVTLHKVLNLPTANLILRWEREHTPKVGDVYKSMFGNLCVVTMVKKSDITKVYADGSGGYENLETFKRDFRFTGKNIGDKVDKLLKAI